MRKVMVDQVEVKNTLRSGMKVYTMSKKFDMPISVIKDIRDGKDRPFFIRKPIKDKNRFCTCCGFREKMPGAKYLCYVCFAKHSGESGVDEHRILA